MSDLTPTSATDTRRRKVSCAECRRLKLRCMSRLLSLRQIGSREWPCTECVRRGTAQLCPESASKTEIPKSKQILQLQKRIVDLESTVQDQIRALSRVHDSPATLTRTALPTNAAGPSPQEHSPSTKVELVGRLTREKTGNSRFFGVMATDHRIAVAHDENEDHRRESGYDLVSAGWPLITMRDSSGGLSELDLQAALPPKNEGLELVRLYWELTSGRCVLAHFSADARFEPFTKTVFDESLENSYSSATPSWQHLALVFAVFAFSALFDPLSKSTGKPSLYHRCTKLSLTVGDFMNDVTVASLCTLHLVCGYVLNAEGSLDELYVLVGLAIRLGVVGGYHRGGSPRGSAEADGSWWDIEQPLLDNRRRVWWELTQLERVHVCDDCDKLIWQSFSFGIPCTIPANSDTIKPASLSPISFLWWKWDLQLLASQAVEDITFKGPQLYNVVLQSDTRLREFDATVPEHLRCRSTMLRRLISGDATSLRSIDDYYRETGSANEGIPLALEVQQIRLAQLYNHCLLILHRPSFIMSLNSDPLQSPFRTSVLVVVFEAATNLMELIQTLYRIAPKHVLFVSHVLDLYNSIACVAALLIKCPSTELKQHCLQFLDDGVNLIRRIHDMLPTRRVARLVHRSEALAAEAGTSVQVSQGRAEVPSTVQGELDRQIGGMTNTEFELWLSQILSNTSD